MNGLYYLCSSNSASHADVIMKGYFRSLSQNNIAAIPDLGIDIPTQIGKKCKFSVKKTAMYAHKNQLQKCVLVITLFNYFNVSNFVW
jgi:hypothetical protein